MQTTSVSLLERLASSGDNSDWQRLLQIYKPFVQQVTRGYPELESQADDITVKHLRLPARNLAAYE